MITVVIPLYNKGVRIRRTIESVLAQTYADFHVIVVDDGSTDDSAKYVKEYNDSRIHYFYKENGGVSSARNYGIKNSKSDWLLFLDADDELVPNALEAFITLQKKYPKSNYLVGLSKWYQNNVDITKAIATNQSYISNHPFFAIWLGNYYPGTRNMLVHRSLIENYGGFDERMSFYEDWEFSLRLANHARIAFVSEYVAKYNQDGDGLSFSCHACNKDMAFYTEELLEGAPFFLKVLLYDNIEVTKCHYPSDSAEFAMYSEMSGKLFPWYYHKLHWLRQKMIRHNVMDLLNKLMV